MKKSYQVSAKLISFAIYMMVFSANVSAALITNGSLTGPIANMNVPSGWTISSGTPDTMDETNNVGVAGTPFGVAPSGPSANGGTWVGIVTDSSIDFTESFWQNVSGLNSGTTYELSWFQGNFGAILGPPNQPQFMTFYTDPNAVEVLIDSVVLGTGSQLSLGQDWSSDSLFFTATSETHRIEFQSAEIVSSYLSIDEISLVSTVPIPASAWLFCSGIIGLIGVARKGSVTNENYYKWGQILL